MIHLLAPLAVAINLNGAVNATIPPKEISIYDVKQETKTITECIPLVYEYRQKIRLVATAYTSAVDETGRGDGITASGVKASYSRGTTAVPRTGIPFGTKFYIPELDRFLVAEDYGSKNHIKWLDNHTARIDVYVRTKSEAFRFGVKELEGYIYKKMDIKE